MLLTSAPFHIFCLKFRRIVMERKLSSSPRLVEWEASLVAWPTITTNH
jgi:hypothetical protein